MKISYIVPAYNEETRILRAVESILEDKTLDAEVLLVDDGSMDGTGRVCDELAASDARVRAFHKHNGGVGSARNLGISEARGEYIAFCDADDYILPAGVQKLLACAEVYRTDVACANYLRLENGKEFRPAADVTSGIVDYRGKPDEQERFHRLKTESLWNYTVVKLYRASFLREHELTFEKIMMEDALFTQKLLRWNPRIYFLNEPMYVYVIRGDSSSQRADPEIAAHSCALLNNYGTYLDNEGGWEDAKTLFVPLAMRMFCWAIFKNIPFDGFDREKIGNQIRVFMADPYFQTVVRDPESGKYLRELSSLPQRVFYGFCLWSLRCVGIWPITTIFSVCYPLMKSYVGKAVK